jgi:fatty acid desaturase
LFEPVQPLASTFTRSKQLLQRKGRVFILATYVSLAVCLACIYAASMLVEMLISIEKWLIFILLILPTALFFNGIMVIFYRKRRLARKY